MQIALDFLGVTQLTPILLMQPTGVLLLKSSTFF